MKNGKCPAGQYYCYTDKKCKSIPKGFKVVGAAGMLRKENGHSVDDETKNGNGNGNGGSDGGVSEGSLNKWFKGSKSKDGKGGWVNVVTGGTCASDKPGEGTPKCVSSSKRASMSKSERLSASRRKKKADPGQQSKSGAAKPTYVSTDKKKMKEEVFSEEDKKGKGSGTKDACYHKVKSRYSVWPSAYASGALVKCRKKGAANWGNSTKKEGFSPSQIAALEANGFVETNKLGEACWKGYEKKGMKTMFGKRYPNCVKKTKKEEFEVQESIIESVYSQLIEEGYSEDDVEFAIEKALNEAEVTMGHDTPDKTEKTKDKLKKKAKGFLGKVAHKAFHAARDAKRAATPAVQRAKTSAKRGLRKAALKVADKLKEENIDEAATIPRQNGQVMRIFLTFRGKFYMTQLFFPSLRVPSKAEITDAVQKVYPDARVTQYSPSSPDPTQPLIRVAEEKNDGKNDSLDRRDQMIQRRQLVLNRQKLQLQQKALKSKAKTDMNVQTEAKSAAWQRKAGKNKEGGLNEKGRKSYERENPGSDLKAPQPEGGPRKRSFCARMGGMKGPMKDEKGRPTRKALALRKWKC